MRRLLFSLAIIAFSLSCFSQDEEYKIFGKVPSDLKKVYLFCLGERQAIDSVEVQNKEFIFQGKAPLNTIFTLKMGNYYLPIISDGSQVEIDFEIGEFKASKQNEKLFSYDKELNRKYSIHLNEIFLELDSLAEDDSEDALTRKLALEEEYEDLTDKMTDEIIEIVKANKDNMIPVVFISQAVYGLSYEELKDLLSEENPFYNHQGMIVAKAQMEALEKRLPGKMYMDLTLYDEDENPKELSSWCGKGNYVLLDFWASWCGPCRKELPSVKNNYEKYHDSGFEIIGISLDNNPSYWKAAINMLGLNWPQLSDLKAWKSEAAITYGIRAIPANVLLDKEGKIIAVDLLGKKLTNKLEEIFGF